MRILAILLFAATAAIAKPDAGGDLDLRAFQQELDRCTAATQRLAAHPQEAKALRESLPESWTVVSGGQRWVVSTEPLSNDLARIEDTPGQASKAVADARARLTAMRHAAAALDSPAPVASGDPEKKLHAILARKEFHVESTWWDVLRDRVLQWVIEQLVRFFRALDRAGAWSPVLWKLVVVAVGFTGLYFLLRRFLLRPRPLQAEAPERERMTPRYWRQFAERAARAAANHDYRDAVHFAYWACIYRLEELGRWRAERDRTHREYLRLLPADAAERAPLEAVTERFELSWYGGHDISEAEFQVVATQLGELGCPLPSNPATANS